MQSSSSDISTPNFRREPISDEDVIRGFILALGAGGRKQKALTIYEDSIRMLSDFARDLELPGLTTMDRIHIQHWLTSLHQNGNKPATVSVRYRSLNRFFNWCVVEEERGDNPMDRVDPPTIPHEIQPYYLPQDVETLIQSIGRSTPHNFRDAAMIMALYGSGVCSAEFKLSEYNLFDYMPNWVQPLVGTKEERIAKLSEDGIREGMKRDVIDRPHPRTDWTQVQVVEVALERNLKYEGLSIADIAEAEGKHPLDAFLDIALDEDLETEFAHPAAAQSDEVRADRLTNPFVHISVSDGGAHTRFLVNSVWPVYFLAHWIRDRELMTLEQAHQKMSALPAWFSDMKNRGTLRVGDYADIMIYNMDELGLLYDKPRFETDFPGGEKRLVQKPTGIRYIVVNGTVTFVENECTNALPGKLLRSYDMVG